MWSMCKWTKIMPLKLNRKLTGVNPFKCLDLTVIVRNVGLKLGFMTLRPRSIPLPK